MVRFIHHLAPPSVYVTSMSTFPSSSMSRHMWISLLGYVPPAALNFPVPSLSAARAAP